MFKNRHSGGCAGGYPGAAGCLASLTVYKEYASVFEGSLVDVNNARLAGKVSAADKVEAGDGVFILFILPVPYAYPSAPGTEGGGYEYPVFWALVCFALTLLGDGAHALRPSAPSRVAGSTR